MNLNTYGRQCGTLKLQVGNIEEWIWPAVDTATPTIIFNDWVNGIRPVLQKHFPDRGGSVIQAGGNCGMYPLLYKEFFDNIYTFEPDPLSFFCLVNNCQQPGITMMNCALGSKPGSAIINEREKNNRGMNQVIQTKKAGIPIIALDNLDFHDVRLIQLDLEGFEPQALKGAEKTIRQFHPLIILECGDEYERVLPIIEPWGYVKGEKITRLDTVFHYQG